MFHRGARRVAQGKAIVVKVDRANTLQRGAGIWPFHRKTCPNIRLIGCIGRAFDLACHVRLRIRRRVGKDHKSRIG